MENFTISTGPFDISFEKLNANRLSGFRDETHLRNDFYKSVPHPIVLAVFIDYRNMICPMRFLAKLEEKLVRRLRSAQVLYLNRNFGPNVIYMNLIFSGRIYTFEKGKRKFIHIFESLTWAFAEDGNIDRFEYSDLE